MIKKSVMDVDTPFGPMAIGYIGTKIGRVWLPGYSGAKLKLMMREWAVDYDAKSDSKLADKLIKYFNGDPVTFSKTIEYSHLNPFAQKVLTALSVVPWGERITYGELARRAGFTGAARAVGMVMSQNQVPLLVPCHRVVRSDGTIGGFSSPGGVAMKRMMLRLEVF